MLPLYDNIRSRTVPWVTRTLIGVNLAIYFYQVSLDPGSLRDLINTYGLIPALIGAGGGVSEDLVKNPNLLLRFGAFMFLHGSWLHVISNMWYLWVFGDNVEDRLGHGRFLLFYMVAGFASGAAHISFMPHSVLPCIGASGAVAGVLGAYMFSFPGARIATLVPIFFFITIIRLPAAVLLGLWFLTQLLNSQMAIRHHSNVSVAYWAHVGGFVAGIILLGLMAPGRRKRPARENYFRD